MGLIKEGDDFAVLSDILGDEDHLGDMDFKVAGTEDGITALQMDIKITSITPEIMRIALDQAREGRLHILGEMAKAIDQPRDGVSDNAPRITVISIPSDKIREVIGTGGKVIREITETTGAKIDIEDDGTIKVAAVDQSQGRSSDRLDQIDHGRARNRRDLQRQGRQGRRLRCLRELHGGRATDWCTSASWQRTGSIRWATSSRRAPRSRSSASASTTAARSSSP